MEFFMQLSLVYLYTIFILKILIYMHLILYLMIVPLALHIEWVIMIIQGLLAWMKKVISIQYIKYNVSHLANDRITVTGPVEDIRECYASARIFAAPMQTGSGLQTKLREAMAMGLPCVTTSLANDSLCAEKDKEVLVGDTPLSFAECLIALLRDRNRCDILAANGYAFVHDKYSWETAGEKIEEVLRNVVQRGSSKVAHEVLSRGMEG